MNIFNTNGRIQWLRIFILMLIISSCAKSFGDYGEKNYRIGRTARRYSSRPPEGVVTEFIFAVERGGYQIKAFVVECYDHVKGETMGESLSDKMRRWESVRQDTFISRAGNMNFAERFVSAIGEGLVGAFIGGNYASGLLVLGLFLASWFFLRGSSKARCSRWPFVGFALVPGGFFFFMLLLVISAMVSCSEKYKTEDGFEWPWSRSSSAEDSVFYKQAYEEVEKNQMEKALWAKMFAQSGGNENKAKALYIKSRVKALKAFGKS